MSMNNGKPIINGRYVCFIELLTKELLILFNAKTMKVDLHFVYVLRTMQNVSLQLTKLLCGQNLTDLKTVSLV